MAKKPARKRNIEQYDHKDKKRKNNPPVGLVTPETDRETGLNIDITKALEDIRIKLLDLSKRNRLLNFKLNKGSLVICDEQPRQVFQRLFSDGKHMIFSPLPEPTMPVEIREAGEPITKISKEALIAKAAALAGIDIRDEPLLPPSSQGDANEKHTDRYLQTKLFMPELETKLRRIRSDAKSVIDETGQNQLFLALGFLQWKESTDSNDVYEAPLILVPVEIEKGQMDGETRCYHFTAIYTGEDIDFNLSLAEKLKRDFGLSLPTFEDEDVLKIVDGDRELDPEAYFDAVNKTVSKMQGWRVSRKIVLGFFTFSKILMYHDLDSERWPDKKLSGHEIIRGLLGGGESGSSGLFNEEEINENKRIGSLPLVVDADSSQTEAIVESLKGRNLVIQGPPGTGKSQTITNLIACFLNKGKSVLFVAEKMAALNVVKNNLDKVGLGHFCLELHSHKAQKKKVIEDIRKRRDLKLEDAASINSEIDRLRKICADLNDYVEKVGSCVGPDSETVFEIFWKKEVLGAKINHSYPFTVDNIESLTSYDIQDGKEILEHISQLLNELPSPVCNNIWYGYRPMELYYGDHEIIKANLIAAKEIIRQLINKISILTSQHSIALSAGGLTWNDLKAMLGLTSQKIPQNPLQDILEIFLLSQNNKPWEAFERLEATTVKCQELITQSSQVLRDSVNIRQDDISKCNEVLIKIKDEDLISISLGTAKEAGDSLERLRHLVNKCNDFTTYQNSLGIATTNTITEFANFVMLSQLAENKPHGIAEANLDGLFSKSIRRIAGKAFEKAKGLELERKYLDKIFALKDVPAVEAIADIRQILRVMQGKFFAFLSPRYRRTKRTLLAFLRESPKIKSRELIDDLERLEKFIIEEKLFSNNEHFQQVFGSLFKGLNTNWQDLTESAIWATKVLSATASVETAKKIASISDDAWITLQKKVELTKLLNAINKETEIVAKIFSNTPSESCHNILEMPFGELLAFVDRLGNFLTSTYDILAAFTLKNESTFDEIKGVLECLQAANIVRAEIESDLEIKHFIGGSFKGVDSDIAKIAETVEWAYKLKQLELPNEIIAAISKGNSCEIITAIAENAEEWSTDIAKAITELESLNKFGKVDKKFWVGTLEDTQLSNLQVRLDQLIENTEYLCHWADYCRIVDNGKEKGLSSLIAFAERGEIPADQLLDTYLHGIYNTLCKTILRKHPKLATFTRVQYEEKRKRFGELDKNIQRLLQQKIAFKASQIMVPCGSKGYSAAEFTDGHLLTRESRKSKRHIPIRQLMNRAGNAIKALKPVFMMSPMSVAQFLESGKHEFDVIIMDEASQIQPHEALGAIARGKQIIIVGDSQQLPPTTFFDRTLNNEDDDEEQMVADDMDSILDLCGSTICPNQKRLKWHYRSEHESLIAFSNSKWYDNELVIFPSSGSSDTPLGIKYHYVENATYSASRNLKEADFVAQRIVEHAKKYPNLSLGVGTFNIQQKELIEDKLEQLRKANPATDAAIEKLMKVHNGTEPFFIKNLENLQGDERDVIFISCTFGPDKETGQVYKRFGPINNKNGYRRLNVLFTRAKKRMEVFSSMKPEDISLEPGDSEGAFALKEFLKYASTGRLPDLGKITGREPGSDFEISVTRVLQNNGYQAIAQVGVAGYFVDIGVRHPNRPGEYILGIECDGATYHSSRFARDRDRLREEVLIRRGWQIHRIWSTDWFKNRDMEVERLKNKIQSILEQDKHVVRIAEEQQVSQTVVTSQIRKHPLSEEELRKRLIAYRNENIPERLLSSQDGILREEMLEAFITHRPTNMEEYRDRIDVYLRVNTEPYENQYLADIFAIIEKSVE